jgi:hypothetical protein
MGFSNVRQFFGSHVPHLHHVGLSASDQRHLEDVERIAHSLAKQAGAPADEWPFFVEPAESLIRLSRRWTEG